MLPIIGISQPYLTDSVYIPDKRLVSSVIRAGGVPILLPYEMDCIDEYFNLISGLIIPGGVDVEPYRYGEKRIYHYEGDCDKKTDPPFLRRDRFELKIWHKALCMDMPLLGICRGMQVLNVALGGKLRQHIDGHSYIKKGITEYMAYISEYVHTVEITTDSLLSDILGCKADGFSLDVNSVHHQCVEDLGDNVCISAKSPDGIIEAIEVKGKTFAIGVQWHLEELTAIDKKQAMIFEKFIEVAKSKTSH